MAMAVSNALYIYRYGMCIVLYDIVLCCIVLYSIVPYHMYRIV